MALFGRIGVKDAYLKVKPFHEGEELLQCSDMGSIYVFSFKDKNGSPLGKMTGTMFHCVRKKDGVVGIYDISKDPYAYKHCKPVNISGLKNL